VHTLFPYDLALQLHAESPGCYDQQHSLANRVVLRTTNTAVNGSPLFESDREDPIAPFWDASATMRRARWVRSRIGAVFHKLRSNGGITDVCAPLFSLLHSCRWALRSLLPTRRGVIWLTGRKWEKAMRVGALRSAVRILKTQ